MRIATWNVKSLKARLPHVEQWLEYARPDVLCMQETKLADDAFPVMPFNALVMRLPSTRGRWNGGWPSTSRVGLDDVVAGFSEAPEGIEVEARLMSATCSGVRVASLYIPNGREGSGRSTTTTSFRWLAGIKQWLATSHQPSSFSPSAATSTIAPTTATSTTRRSSWAHHVSEPERDALGALLTGASSTGSGCCTTTTSCSPGGTTGPATSTRPGVCGST